MIEKIVLGIDIGGTNTPFGLVDKKGQVIFESALKTKDYPTPQGLIQDLYETTNSFLANEEKYELVGIGIGAPNGNYYKGTIENAPNLVWKGIVPLVKLFSEVFQKPAYVTNDANAAAIGERFFGVAQGIKDFVLVTLGTGVGSGCIVNNKLILGNQGFAGEIGHVIIEPGGRLCGCGRFGCLETYTSAPGVTQTARELMDLSDEESLLRSVDEELLNSEAISKAAEKGDVIALQVFDITAKKLAFGLANVVAILNPETIILFGGLSKAGDLILEPTRQYMNSFLLHLFKNKITLQVSGLQDRNVAVLGASALVWDELLKD